MAANPQLPTNGPKLLTRAQAAAMLEVSLWALYEGQKKGAFALPKHLTAADLADLKPRIESYAKQAEQSRIENLKASWTEARRDEHSEKLRGKPRPGRVNGYEESLDKWKLVCSLVKGDRYPEIGKKLHRNFATVRQSAIAMGFPKGGGDRRLDSVLYNLGDPLDGSTVTALKNACGLSPQMFAELTGVTSQNVRQITCSAYKQRRVEPETAAKIIGWRDGLISAALSVNWSKKKRGREGISGPAVIRTLFPKLGEKYQLLLKVLKGCRRWKEFRACVTAEEIGALLCDRAQLETGQDISDKVFAPFLPWAPELMPFLNSNLVRITGSGPLCRLAYEAFAVYWKLPPKTVAAVIQRQADAKVISPTRMYSVVGIAQIAKPSRGPKTAAAKGVEKIHVRVGKVISDLVPPFNELFAIPSPQWERKGFAAELIEAAERAEATRGISKAERPRVAARYLVATHPRKYGFETNSYEYDTIASHDRQFVREAKKLGLSGRDNNSS